MTKDFAGYIYQSILMCMQEHNHLPGVPCDIKDFEESLAAAEILWTREFSEKIAKMFGVPSNAAELAGEGIAFLTILAITDYTILERSNKGTGVDFWLGYKDDVAESNFQRAARMEVKGRTRLENDSQIRDVVRKGLKQTRRSAATRLPAYVILTEFSRPVIYMVQP